MMTSIEKKVFLIDVFFKQYFFVNKKSVFFFTESVCLNICFLLQ